jgi:hypothetical protein
VRCCFHPEAAKVFRLGYLLSPDYKARRRQGAEAICNLCAFTSTGGVGRLLFTTTGTTTNAVGYDANGNVETIFAAATGAAVGEYDYGPFGELLA